MDEKQFLRTMIETLKWDGEDYENKDIMLSILRYAEIDFEKTTTFTRKSYQYYEDIAIRVRIPMLKEAKKLIHTFRELVTFIYRETEEYDLGKVIIRPKFVEGQEIEVIEHSVAFEEIREEIIQGIRIAKYVIWVSVAWFTDKAIYQELLAKKNEGVQCRIITSDATNNDKLKVELINNFNALFVPGFGAYGNNLVHNKFCIIDFEFVMHGSYNWTYAAEYNDETWITSIDKELVAEFAEEFKQLYVKFI
jgi:phosphatidylserine/phosphatidylglycerophosphate/cardiolipin synthase-like enzyme